ncbi:hypothetical protein BT96DRAFT_955426 [Gymnopus androsaceus JB14]|uniref:DUF6533 domain-containing protein n=1 Tax=Gymnopus androsaceus JB14 TaxID=1447944 RepID=A0A6A4I845_9AGAR|nr:hypothetical protein BT96DRAFT_955426 [Gymnopus androsaceus JB14]
MEERAMMNDWGAILLTSHFGLSKDGLNGRLQKASPSSSMPVSPADAAYEHYAHSSFIKFRMQYCSIAVLYYDYALTFPDEVRYIWRRKSLTQISTLLYILCRYAIPGNLLYLLANTGSLGGGCNTWYRFVAALSVMGRASIIVKTDVLSILIPVYDFFVAAFTIIRGIQALKHMPPTASLQDSFYYILVEQESPRAISLITVTVSVVNFHPVSPTGGAAFLGRLNAIAVPISGVLIARFLLRLRAAQEAAAPSGDPSALSTCDYKGQAEFTFRRAIDSVMHEFGDDPVERTKDMVTLDSVEEIAV